MKKNGQKKINMLAHFLAKQEGWNIKKNLDLHKSDNPRAYAWIVRAREILEFLETQDCKSCLKKRSENVAHKT